MKRTFIETDNFEKFQSLYESLAASEHGLEMAAVVAPAGRGKTTAAERIVFLSPAATYVRYCGWMTAIGIIREIAFAASGTRPRATESCLRVIREEMTRQRRVILLDEADRMSLSQLDQLRDFHDVFGAPVIFLGEEPLMSKLEAARRLSSRTQQVLTFQPVSQVDVGVYYREVFSTALHPDHTAALTAHSGGDFRSVVSDALAVERILAASGISDITDAVVRQVTGNGKRE